MGGTPVAPVKLYGGSKGGWVNFPEPTSGYGTFAGWYLDEDRDKPFTVFTYEDEVKLYAKWDAYYEIGDTGPGDGIIFYRKELGFPIEGYTHPDIPDYSGNFLEYKAYYLEAAPAGWWNDGANDPSLRWAPAESDAYIPAVEGARDSPTGTIGTGRKNTALILVQAGSDTAVNAPAANACNTYDSANNWFLPSMFELQELSLFHIAAKNGSYPGLTTGLADHDYWTSTQRSIGSDQVAMNHHFTTDISDYTTKSSFLRVRPIRAF